MNKMMNDQELHVLAVDDSNIDRKVIERLLKVSSFKVTVVDSGSRALQYLGLADNNNNNNNSTPFDDLKVNMIITDYSMPGMTGFELLKKIKNSSTLKEIPVVIMSSENILTRIDRCLEEGAEDYLLKPVKLSDVRRLKDSILKTETRGVELHSENNRKRKRGDDRLPVLPSSKRGVDRLPVLPSSKRGDDRSPVLPSSKRGDDRLPVLPSSLSCHKNVSMSPPASPAPKLC